MIMSIDAMRKRLRMRHLRLLVSLSEQGSLRRAADDMALTQPAVTKSLQELEDLVGVTLFTRHVKGILPTVFGEAAIRYARGVLADMNGLRDELAAIQDGRIGKVQIGAIMAPTLHFLGKIIADLKKEHGGLHVSVQIDTSDVLVQGLRLNHLDLAVGRIPDGDAGDDLEFTVLGEEGLSIVTRPGHPVLSEDTSSFDALMKYPWVIQSRASPMRQIIDQTFREARVRPPTNVVETSSVVLMLSLMHDADMIAVLSEPVARYYENLGVTSIVPLNLYGRLTPYGLIMRRNRDLSPASQLVVSAIHQAASLSSG